MRQRGKTGRITGLACATPAPVSFFRLRQTLGDKKNGENMNKKEKWLSAPPTEIVCYCLGVNKGTIIEAIKSGCNSLKTVKDATKACTGNECENKNPSKKCCSQDILAILDLYSDNACNSAIVDSPCCCKNEK